jgi:arabinose-5-phosphate isomerase
MSKRILQELLKKQQEHLNHFFGAVDLTTLEKVFTILCECKGMIILTGVGKSGLVAKKTAVTMTSTGSRAVFLSPTNALHGDIGIINSEDVFVIISKSGESDEILNLIPFVRNRGIKIVGIVSNLESRLARAVDLVFVLPQEPELCPYDMAPTTSTTMQAIIGDVLSVALMVVKEFTLEDYAKSHPAGRIGRRMIVKVCDLMLKDKDVPLCKPNDKLIDTLVELSNKKCGCVLVVDESNNLLGIFTDGDLRRSLQSRGAEALESTMKSLMVNSAKFIGPNELAWSALKKMEFDQKHPVMVLPVIDDQNKVVGIIKMHDLVQSGI